MSTQGMRNMLEIAQDEMIMRDRISALLQNGPKTIPELSEELGSPSYEVVIWLMSMRRFGQVEEVGRPDVDGYFKYELKAETSETAEE